MPLLLIALAAAAVLYWQKGKEFLSAYKVKFIDALFDKNKTRDAFYAKFFFTIRIEVDNVTDFTGTLQRAKLKLSYEGKQLGTVEKNTAVTITKNAKTRIEIPVAVPTLSFLTSLPALISAVTGGKELMFKINGELIFGIGTVTVNEQYKVATNV
jgi:hypothetical protein